MTYQGFTGRVLDGVLGNPAVSEWSLGEEDDILVLQKSEHVDVGRHRVVVDGDFGWSGKLTVDESISVAPLEIGDSKLRRSQGLVPITNIVSGLHPDLTIKTNIKHVACHKISRQ